MKRLVLAIIVLFTITISASAMSYAQAREQALFLTDKMAYELDLTDEQYEAAYEINLDYLMSINRYDDLYGAYWTQRNLDLSYILYDWQYRNYVDASYFYRPLYWNGGYWHFGVYARYPHRDYYFFGQPNIYVSYRGGHSWRMNGGACATALTAATTDGEPVLTDAIFNNVADITPATVRSETVLSTTTRAKHRLSAITARSETAVRAARVQQ